MTADYLGLLLADGRLPVGAHAQSAGVEPAMQAGLPLERLPDYLAVRLRTVTEVEAATAVVARHLWLEGHGILEAPTIVEALVAVVNHRHGTTDWMPIDLRIYENFNEAVARYKHFDLLMVNSLFYGMNLVAKEAPAVNTRDGVVMLSENTGAHEELGDCTLSVNPFDIQEQADTMYRALTMDDEERQLRASRLREIVRERDPGVWIEEQLADIRAKRESDS